MEHNQTWRVGGRDGWVGDPMQAHALALHTPSHCLPLLCTLRPQAPWSRAPPWASSHEAPRTSSSTRACPTWVTCCSCAWAPLGRWVLVSHMGSRLVLPLRWESWGSGVFGGSPRFWAVPGWGWAQPAAPSSVSTLLTRSLLTSSNPSMPFIPPPSQGMFATWHLRTVEVVHLSTGDTWAFGCHSWIDKKTQWQKILTAQRAR